MDGRKRITVYTDGSCVGNPGKGGYCAIIKNGRKRQTITGNVPHSTNNRMELKAVIEGLSAVPCDSSVTVYTDSSYIERAVNDGRLAQWQQNGWRRIRTGTEIVNKDAWQSLLSIISEKKLEVSFRKVDAHKGHYFNERVDFLARRAAKEV